MRELTAVFMGVGDGAVYSQWKVEDNSEPFNERSY